MTILSLLSFAAPRPAVAASIETLLMPGKVSQAHAKYESECSLCHDRTDRSRQTALCADCHKDIAADLAAKSRPARPHGQRRQVAVQVLPHRAPGSRSRHRQAGPRAASIIAPRTSSSRARTAASPARAATPPASRSARRPSGCGDCHKDDDAHAGQLGAEVRHLPHQPQLERRQVRPRQDRVPAARRARDDHLRRLPPRRPLQGHAAALRGLPRARRRARGLARREVRRLPHDRELEEREVRPRQGDGLRAARSPFGARLRRLPQAGRLQGRAAARLRRLPPAPTTPTRCASARTARPAMATTPGSRSPTTTRASTKFALEGAHAKLDCHACHTAPVEDAEARQGLRELPSRQRPARRRARPRLRQLPWHREVAGRHPLRPRPHRLPAARPARHRRLRPVPRLAGLQGRAAGLPQLPRRRTTSTRAASARTARPATRPTAGRPGTSTTPSRPGSGSTGAHGKLKCVDCHRQPAGLVKLPGDCASCHRKDDIHLGQYGPSASVATRR